MLKTLVDFHCHLDLYENFSELLLECESRKIYTLAVTTTPRAWKVNNHFTKSTRYVHAALGLHPQLVGELHHETAFLCELISETSYIGEIGLDGSLEYRASMELQKAVFRKILAACLTEGGRIMSIHSRGAAEQVLDILEAHKKAGLPVLHWFSGNQKELNRAISLGCWFSVGPAMLNTKRGVEIIKRIPRDKILTETDGPFTKQKGKILVPWDVEIAVQKISLIWQETPDYIKEIIASNLCRLLNIS